MSDPVKRKSNPPPHPGPQDQKIPAPRAGRRSFSIKATGADAYAYDFAAARLTSGPFKTTNILETTGHLMKTCIGGGAVGIHTAYKRCGLFSALFVNIVAGMMLIHSKFILVNSAQTMYGRLHEYCLSYPDLAEASLKNGPFPKLKRFSTVFRYMVDITICINLFGSCCVYAAIIGHSLEQILEESGAIEDYNVRFYIACTVLPLILICMILSMKYLAPFSILGNILLLILAGATVYYGCKSAEKSPTEFPLTRGAEGFFEFLGVCVFSMEGMGVVLTIENHMKEPKKFPMVLCMGMSIVVSFVMTIGFFGYWGFGDKAVTPVTMNFPWEVFPIILKFSLSVVIYLTYALNFWSPFNLVWTYIKRRHNPAKYWLTERLYRAGFVVGLCLLAIAFPNINAFMGFLGSFCISLMGFIYPPFIDLMVKWNEPGLGAGKWRLYKNGFVIFFGVSVGILGTYTNVKNLIVTAV